MWFFYTLYSNFMLWKSPWFERDANKYSECAECQPNVSKVVNSVSLNVDFWALSSENKKYWRQSRACPIILDAVFIKYFILFRPRQPSSRRRSRRIYADFEPFSRTPGHSKPKLGQCRGIRILGRVDWSSKTVSHIEAEHHLFQSAIGRHTCVVTATIESVAGIHQGLDFIPRGRRNLFY